MAARGDIPVAWIEGTIRDPTTPANIVSVNADGSINISNTQGSYTPAFAPGVGGQQSQHVELLLAILFELKALNSAVRQTLDPFNTVEDAATIANDPTTILNS